MNCILLETKNPYFNLAIEEILLKKREEEYLILGINSNSVIIGKHQSAHKEVNTRYITEHNIPVVRRISGGGTVFHDEGNLNFTFICKSEEGKQVDFRKYTRPVIEFLLTMGVEARFEGKNDLKVDGLKISGNAEHVHRNRVLHHGTLLFSSSLERLHNTLRKDRDYYKTRGVDSNPSSVTNLMSLIPTIGSIEIFRKKMMDYFLSGIEGAKEYSLSDLEKEEAELLVRNKYKTWEWNWAYGPEYSLEKKIEISGKSLSLRVHVKDGIISDCLISGSADFEKVAEIMTGQRHMVDDLLRVMTANGILTGMDDIYKFF